MRIKVVTLSFNEAMAGFDDDPMREFLADKDVVFIREHFFKENNRPYIAIIACYHETVKERAQLLKKKNRDEWRKHLKDDDLPLFNTLREWRLERSRSEGVPPYIVFDNVQLARIAKNRPESLAGLQAIPGIGKGKSEKYGNDIIKLTAATLDPQLFDEKSARKLEASDNDEQPR